MKDPSDTLRVALVGCGWYAPNHLHAWRDLAPLGVVLAGVCDIDPVKAATAAAAFDAPAFNDPATLIDTVQPDLVDIVTNVRSHRELVVLAAARGVGAIVQKPMAPDWVDCVAMAEAVSGAGIFFGVHENFRFQSAMRRVKRLLENDVVGPPSFARIAFRTTFDTIRAQPYLRREKRFVLMDIGVHVLDLARFFLGDVERLSCETQRRRADIAGEDTATMLLRHQQGSVSVVECSFSAQRIVDCFPETLIEIEGPDGCIVVNPGSRIQVRSKGVVWQESASAPLLAWSERPLHVTQESVLTFNRHVVEAFRADRQPETGLADSLKTFALVDAAYRSADERRSIVPHIYRADGKIAAGRRPASDDGYQ